MAIKGKRFLSVVINLLFVFLAVVTDVSSAPILRMEVGQHTAIINRMAVDKEAKLLATVADDKTLRLWNLPEGTLYTTLRVPIDEQLKGALYAVAVSPDGKTVITAGETMDDQKKFSLYVFDVEKRVLKARIANLPSAIFHLAYSKDGKQFAAAFSGGFGLRVWDSQTGKLLAQDPDYSERSNWLDFSAAGLLATVSHDGYVRLYDGQYKLLQKAMLNPQGKPSSISFSGNGQLLAIGYANLLQVDIIDLNLKPVATLPVENLTGTSASIVEWQQDSNTALYAAGDMKTAQGRYVIRHWQDIGSATKNYRDVEVSGNIVTDIIALPNTNDTKIDVLFSSADPAWGSLKNDSMVYNSHANLWDARLVELPGKTFAISEDGLKIAYSQHPDGDDVSVFDITRLSLQSPSDKELIKTLSPAITAKPHLKITHWQRDVPEFNGVRRDFEDYEKSYALAMEPSSDRALIGTNYNLRWYDGQGKAIKKIPVTSAVYGLSIAGNGKLAVAALGDGTLRWYSLSPGEELTELVVLFPYNDSKDWIVWTKEGFFGSSDGGGYRLAGYHLNKGETKRPEWIEFSQIYQVYYAPELILPKLLRQEDKIKAKLNTIENVDDRFNKNAVPIIELVEYCISPNHTDTKGFIRTSLANEVKTADLGFMEKVKLLLKAIVAWIDALFGAAPPELAQPVPQLASADPLPKNPICYPITGQGQTRGFVRKEKIQATVFRNQLANNTGAIDLHYVVKPRDGGVGDIDIYVNGQIQHSQKQVQALASTGQTFTQTIALKEGENEISVHAYEKSGGTAAISDALDLINPAIPNRSAETEAADKPRLIVVAVAIDHYQAPNALKYAVKDSKDFLATVSAKKSHSYAEVLPFPLFDEQATLANIEATFDKIAGLINKNDTVLIYLSGHGLRDERDFYFIPYEVNDDKLDETALSQGILKKNIAKLSISNRIFIFLDSCHSGAVDFDGIANEVTSFDKIKHQLGDNVFILAASGENQEAQDQFMLENHEQATNGLFAYAVLEGLNGQARRLDDNIVDNFNLGNYVQRRIDAITKNQTLYKQKARFQSLEAGDVLNFDITHYE
ncbi:MAG: caspase family protein [Methylococcales bacterium]|nr:caspase family protein [Methylococcales bacterium]